MTNKYEVKGNKSRAHPHGILLRNSIGLTNPFRLSDPYNKLNRTKMEGR